jgi:release factor glutamine methyltransferase
MIDRSIGTTLRLAARRLFCSDTASLDAELLLMKALGVSRALLLTWPQRQLTEQELQLFETLLIRREAGEPIAHITGHKHFWTLELAVTDAVIIPRPETELIVEWVTKSFLDDELKVVDMGTGSGAIALSLAYEKPHWQILATDVSSEALAVAEKNADYHDLKSVEFRQSDWCQALEGETFDVVISNPPYIAPGDPHLCIGDVRFEPRRALVASQFGFADLFRIMAQAKTVLKSGGTLVLEHGFSQGEKVRERLAVEKYHDIETLIDLSGNERITVAQYS